MAFSSPTHSHTQTHPDMPSIPIQLVPSEAHPGRVYKCVFSGCSEIQRRRLVSRGSFILPRRARPGPGSGQDLKGQSGTLGGEGIWIGQPYKGRNCDVLRRPCRVAHLSVLKYRLCTSAHTHICSRLLWMLLPRTFHKW